MKDPVVLEVQNLKKRFRRNPFWGGEQEILRGLHFTVPQGSCTGFLGPNGSGKTTAFKCLLRLIRRDAGNIRFFGESGWTSALKARIGFLPENPSFYEEMTLRETVLFFGRLSLFMRPARPGPVLRPARSGAPPPGLFARLAPPEASQRVAGPQQSGPAETQALRTSPDLRPDSPLQTGGAFCKEVLEKRAEFLMEKAGLLQEADKPLRSFSKGMTQKAGLLSAFIHAPDFALLDEPFSGLDPEGRAAAFSLIEDMKREGRTVLLSSHILPDMERLCDRLLILKEGRIVFQGTKEELLQESEGGGRNGGLERRRIVFRKDSRQSRLNNLSLSECQKEIDRLRKEKCDILSIEREQPDLESACQKILSGS